MLGRRLSIASSVSEAGSSFWNEEDLQALTDEQIGSVHEEVKKTIRDLQEEIDLFNKFFSSLKQTVPQQGKDGVTAASQQEPTGSSSGTTTSSSLEVGTFLDPGTRRTSIGSKSKLSDREKCWLWQRELEMVMANRRELKKTFEREIKFLKICDIIAREQESHLKKSRLKLQFLANDEVAPVKKKSKHRSPTNRLALEDLLKFLETLRRSYLQGEVANKRKAALFNNTQARESKFSSLHQSNPQSIEVMQVNLKSELEDQKTFLERTNSELNELRKRYNNSYSALTSKEKEMESFVKSNQQLEKNLAIEERRLQQLQNRSKKVDEFLDLANKNKKVFDEFQEIKKELPTIDDYFLNDPSVLKQKNLIGRKAIADQILNKPCKLKLKINKNKV